MVNDVMVTHQSTYQQMNMGGDTHSMSETGRSQSEQYQPLASNSSGNQLSARDSARPTHASNQFGRFQSHISNFEKLAQEQRSTSRDALPEPATHVRPVSGAVACGKDAVSEPSMITKRTEMRSDAEQSLRQNTREASTEDDNFQQFQMY